MIIIIIITNITIDVLTPFLSPHKTIWEIKSMSIIDMSISIKHKESESSSQIKCLKKRAKRCWHICNSAIETRSFYYYYHHRRCYDNFHYGLLRISLSFYYRILWATKLQTDGSPSSNNPCNRSSSLNYLSVFHKSFPAPNFHSFRLISYCNFRTTLIIFTETQFFTDRPSPSCFAVEFLYSFPIIRTFLYH